MAVSDSGDYELMPKDELEDLRRQVSSLKKNSMSEGDKARILIESMDRLTISINRLITILDDAQKDIIDEYQQSKPTEKLNQILEQNEVIAKALLAMHGNLSGDSNPGIPVSVPSAFNASPQGGSRNVLSKSDTPGASSGTRGSIADNPYSMMPPSMPSMEDLPPMDSLPPLDNPSPNIPKKRFLGMM